MLVALVPLPEQHAARTPEALHSDARCCPRLTSGHSSHVVHNLTAQSSHTPACAARYVAARGGSVPKAVKALR